MYLLLSVGIVKASHFWMGREASVSCFTAEAERCPCGLVAGEEDHCCDDNTVVMLGQELFKAACCNL